MISTDPSSGGCSDVQRRRNCFSPEVYMVPFAAGHSTATPPGPVDVGSFEVDVLLAVLLLEVDALLAASFLEARLVVCGA